MSLIIKTINVVVVQILWASLILTPAFASEETNFSFISQVKTPIEQVLQNPDLAVTGLGVGAYKAQLNKRLDYAKDHNWLPVKQLEEIKAQLQLNQQKENGLRDTNGCLSFEQQQELLKDLSSINDRFENIVFNREQIIQARNTLLAEQEVIYHSIEKGVKTKKLGAKLAEEFKAKLDDLDNRLKNQELSQETTCQINDEMTQLKYSVNKELKSKKIAAKRRSLAAKIKHTHTY